MLADINHGLFRVGAGVGRGLFEIFSSSCKNSFVVLENVWKDYKQYSLKMYIPMKHQFFWYDKNTITENITDIR